MKQLDIKSIQLVSWWSWKGFKVWSYPRDWRDDPVFKRPIFYGILLGFWEVRIFTKDCTK